MIETLTRVLVTGATGTVGRALVDRLLGAGVRVRALVRDPRTSRTPNGVEPVQGDLTSGRLPPAALEGVRAAFLVWPITDLAETERVAQPLIGDLSASVHRIVLLSAAAAVGRRDTTWSETERLVSATADRWALLRPTGFAKNAGLWAAEIRAGDIVRWPYAGAARSPVHEADLADVAATALLHGALDGASPVLSGPEALTFAAQVATIGEVLGRRLRFDEMSPEEAEPMLARAFGDERFARQALAEWRRFVGHPEEVTTSVQDILGRRPRSLREWVEEHADRFR